MIPPLPVKVGTRAKVSTSLKQRVAYQTVIIISLKHLFWSDADRLDKLKFFVGNWKIYFQWNWEDIFPVESFIGIFLYSFTLDPAYSKECSKPGKLVLRHSVPYFPQNFPGISCWVAELKDEFCFVTRANE